MVEVEPLAWFDSILLTTLLLLCISKSRISLAAWLKNLPPK
jgi:hypothetical protein